MTLVEPARTHRVVRMVGAVVPAGSWMRTPRR